MKVKKLTQKLFQAILNKDKSKEKKLWLEGIKKSLKHKKTQAIQ
jgi:hypothetical protein